MMTCSISKILHERKDWLQSLVMSDPVVHLSNVLIIGFFGTKKTALRRHIVLVIRSKLFVVNLLNYLS